MTLSVGQKLGAVVALLALLAAGLSAFAFWQSLVQGQQTADIESVWDFALEARDLSQSVEHVAVVANSVFTSDDTEEVKGNLKFLQGALDRLQHASDSFLAHAGSRLSDEEKTRLALDVKDFISYHNDTVQMGLTISPKAALIQANDDAVVKDREKMIADMDKLSQAALGELSAERDANAASRRRSDAWLIAVAGGGILTGVLAAMWMVTTQIRRPLKKIISAMRLVAEGELDTKIPYVGKRDEIGEMAQALVLFKNAAMAKVRRDVEIEEERHRNSRERRLAEEEAVQSEREIVSASLGEGLARLSAKDLTFRMARDVPASYRRLQTDFNSALAQLEATISDVTRRMGAVQSGVGHISAAAEDLSARTEQQAASLEETAASLEQISATVNQTAEGAAHARDLVSTAKADAEKSGVIVHNAVEAMNGIEQSSTQIGQIIGVIDEIAFQTNLLALNAGVEAARAGDSGRGFAVVASEVRALAQRSADAAKEIKGLISTSTVQVDKGVELVMETGRALARIVAQVAEINGIISGIAASAKEQAVGLQQVNIAVNQMDQVTQQNAAMVEETTASARLLMQETQELGRTIDHFRVGQQGDSASRLPIGRSELTRPAKKAAALV